MRLVDALAEASAAGRPLLTDGAMATSLFAEGLALDEPPESWTADHPDRIVAVHRRFIAAGADIVLTNSFGANAARLARHGRAYLCRALNVEAARLARCVADAAGRPIVVAGAVGPTGERLAPHGPLDPAAARAMFAAQIEGLAEGGADLAWIETMSATHEMRAAAMAAADVGLPFVVTASFDARGETLAGDTPAAVAGSLAGLPSPPLAIGANCGTGPAAILRRAEEMGRAWPGAVIAKPNAGLPVVAEGRLLYPVNPAAVADFARQAAAVGIAIVGGCCGTTPGDVAAMRQAIDRLAVSPRGHFAAQ